MIVDYHIHAVAHGEYSYTAEWLRRFIEQARIMGVAEIGFSEHDEFMSHIQPDLIESLRREYPDNPLRIGLEIDYIPGREEHIKKLTEAYCFDYIMGSVHYIGGWGFDHPDYRLRFEELDVDDIYNDYFNLVRDAVKSGLFDVVSHLDLVKVWGHRPVKRCLMEYVEPVLQCIKEAGMVIEINSGGLRKPVKEIYPSFDIIRRMADMGIPITLGSDAHHPDQVGCCLAEAAEIVRQAGYQTIIMFDSRRKIPALL